jgi:hypothetical protein
MVFMPRIRQAAPVVLVGSVALCATALVGCDDDAALWGDAMTPTQMQQQGAGPGPAPAMFATSSGDNEDPFIDNANYPFVESPWWSNPAYNGG